MSRLACVAIVKNEEAGIAEWIAYQLALGFDAVIIYDNGSTDGTVAQARVLAARHDVRIIDWMDTSPRYQILAYEHAVRQLGTAFDWMAFFDTDEFLVLEPPFDLRGVLGLWTEASAIGVPWAMFGSSGHIRRPERLVIEAFCCRAPDDFFANRHVKSIIRPSRMRNCSSPHVFHMDGSYFGLTGLPLLFCQNTMLESEPDFALGKLHHYFTRSREQWAMKIRRGYHGTTRSFAEFNIYDRNEIFDDSATRYARAVRAILAG